MTKGRDNMKIGEIGQWGGMAMIIAALIVMLALGSPVQNDLITSASLLYAISTKIKYYGTKYNQQRRQRMRVSIRSLIDGK